MKHAIIKLTLLVLVAPALAMEPVPAATAAPATPAAPAATATAVPARPDAAIKPAAAVAAPGSAANAAATLQPAVQTSANAIAVPAQDRLELDATQITGNRELPRVLYVVPWKRADLGELAGRPANSLLDEVLAPVDRDVFRRQNRYYQALKPDSAGTGKVSGTEGEK